VSVVTDREFFQGGLTDLEAARRAVALPVLRKDFTIAAAQILEAAAHGADAILLIAAILTAREIRDLREAAARSGVAALVEVHNRHELDAALDAGSGISESGIRDAGDIARLRAAGYTAFLVGEHLMKSRDPASALRKLVGP